MAKQDGKKFVWVLKSSSSLQGDHTYSVPLQIGDYKWYLVVYPKGYNNDYLDMSLVVADYETLPSGWRKYVNIKLTTLNQFSPERSVVVEEKHILFSEKMVEWYLENMISRAKLYDEDERFLVNGELHIAAEIEALEVLVTPDGTEVTDDYGEKLDVIMKSKQVEEKVDVKGFQVLPSQVEYVRRIFEKHPELAVEFRAKNQHLKTTCMSFLLSLIETLCQSLEELSNEDLVEADIALTYVKDAGFKVDWLEKKLEEVKAKKEKEKYGFTRLQEIEDHIMKLKEKCSELDALAEKEKAELLVTRTPLSFEDLV